MAQNKPKNPKLHARLKREHQEARRTERETKEQQRFTAPPTPKRARNEAHAFAALEANPVIRGYREESASLGKQAQQENQWYNQLGAEQAQAAQGELSGANQLNTNLTAQLAQANSQNEAYLASQQQAQAQQSALTGVPMAASSGQAAAAGANIGQQTAVALNAPTLAAARNQAALTNRLGIASKERGHEVSQGILGERKKAVQNLHAAQGEKGHLYVGKLAEERESARKGENEKKLFELEGQEAAAKLKAEQEQFLQDERQNKRSNAATIRGQNVTAADSAASTAASTISSEASARNARIAAKKLKEEQAYKKAHGGRTPAEVASAQKEHREKVEPVEKEKKNIGQAATTIVTSVKGNKTFEALSPTQKWAFVEQALENQGYEAALAHQTVEKLKTHSSIENAASGLGGF